MLPSSDGRLENGKLRGHLSEKALRHDAAEAPEQCLFTCLWRSTGYSGLLRRMVFIAESSL